MNLKEYIKTVFELEVSLYIQNQLIQQYQAELNAKPKLYEIKEVKSWERSSLSNPVDSFIGLIFFVVGGGIAGAILGFFLANITNSGVVFKTFFFGGIGLGFVIHFWLAYSDAKDDAEMQKRVDKYNQQATEQNQFIAEKVDCYKKNLTVQINHAIPLYKKTEALLKQYYDLDIIYPKYRSLVPIAMFHDYLSSGICSQLEGSDGTYKFYEEQIRMNMIIIKLDIIIEKLDEIIDNQYMLANAIQESNRISKNIYNEICDCSLELKEINANSETSKYYNGITAMNTTYMAHFKKYSN